MDLHIALKRAARAEYAVLRIPLHIVDDRVMRRYLDENSAVRQSYERALERLDGLVEQLVRDPDEMNPSTSEPPWKSAPNTQSEPDAAPTPEAHDDPPPAGESAPDLPLDEVERISTLTEELLDQQETETFVGELAEDSDLRQIQAELKAKHLIEEQEE